LPRPRPRFGGLRSHDVTWSAQDREELLATADESLDRLIRLVENLLDLSRLQAGALSVFIRPVALDELIPLALDDLGPGSHDVIVRLPEDLPDCLADAALLERVVANLIANALRHSPPRQPAAPERQHPRRPDRTPRRRPWARYRLPA
jgi:two-component system sensor histidine kinase KdpD